MVDLKAGTLMKQIPDQIKVSGVAYAGDLDMIFVGNGGGVCNGIDGKDYKTVFSTKAEKADNVYYHSGNKLVYVAHGETVSVLDARKKKGHSSYFSPSERNKMNVPSYDRFSHLSQWWLRREELCLSPEALTS